MTLFEKVRLLLWKLGESFAHFDSVDGMVWPVAADGMVWPVDAGGDCWIKQYASEGVSELEAFLHAG